MHDAIEWVKRFAGLRVLVVGDSILDSYLEGDGLRFCREAPVPNVSVHKRVDRAGGAANTAVNLRALGAAVDYLSVVGADAEGDRLLELLQGTGVGVKQVLRSRSRRTRTKHRVLAETQLLLSFDSGDTGPVKATIEQRLRRALQNCFHDYDAVIVADYDYGLLSNRGIDTIARLQRHRPQLLVVDSRRRLDAFRITRPSAVKPNYEEAAALLGAARLHRHTSRWEAIEAHGPALLELTGAQLAAVTLDRDGALLLQPDGQTQRVFARPTQLRCAAGAGDTFIAALTLALAAGASARLAGELAAAASAIVVTDPYTAACSATQLLGELSPASKYDSLAVLRERVACYRKQGRRIVLTNGCFDLLHSGHVALLAEARQCGDVLIVGVNSDASIRRLKGPTRPVSRLEDRVRVLAALSSVDHVVAFEEDTCCVLVEALRPDVYVKGGDYTRETLPEAALVESLGGMVRFIPHTQPHSTTHLIQRIRSQDDGPMVLPETAAAPAARAV